MQLFFQTRAGTWSSCDRGSFSTILMEEDILPGAVPEFQNIRFLKKQIMPLHCIEHNIILKSVQLKAHNLNDRKITFSS